MVNEAEARALKIQQSRRELLETLKLFYPAEVDFRSISLSLPRAELRHLEIDLNYLIDKGYVVWVDRQENARVAKGCFRLTASGVETADWINKDAALGR